MWLYFGVTISSTGWMSLKKTKGYDYMKLTERFSMFPGVLKCHLPFHWFKTNGKRICDYLQANEEEGRKWQT